MKIISRAKIRPSQMLQSTAILFSTLAAIFTSLAPVIGQDTDEKPWRRQMMPPDMYGFSLSPVHTYPVSQGTGRKKPKPNSYFNQYSNFKKIDPTLHFISADEPFVQPGSPPMPASVDCDLDSSKNIPLEGFLNGLSSIHWPDKRILPTNRMYIPCTSAIHNARRPADNGTSSSGGSTNENKP